MISLKSDVVEEILSSINKGVRSVLKEDTEVNPLTSESISQQRWASIVIAESINRINALPEYTYSVDGIPLEEVLIPNIFSDFILPESVRMDVNNKMQPDLLIRPKSNDFHIDRAALAKAAMIIAKSRKADKVNVSPITDFRMPKSIADLGDRIAIAGWGLNTKVNSAIAIELSEALSGVYAKVDYGSDVSEAENLYVKLFAGKTNIE